MSLETGIKAVEQGNYLEAVGYLEAFCQKCPDILSRDYQNAKMWLALAYHGLGEVEMVSPLCQELSNSPNPEVSEWAKQWLKAIAAYKYTPQYLNELKNQGQEALKQKNYPQAIKLLEDFCKNTTDHKSLDYQQAKMWLVQAYKGNHQMEGAMFLCLELEKSDDTMIRQWAKQTNPTLKANLKNTVNNPNTPLTQQETLIELLESGEEDRGILEEETQIEPSERDKTVLQEELEEVEQVQRQPIPLKLAIRGLGSNLGLALGVTIALLFGMVLSLCLGVVFVVKSHNPGFGLSMAIFITIIVNLLAFFLSPLLMDFIQKMLYKTEWVNLEELRTLSAKGAQIIEEVCELKKIKFPRLGIIDDDTPTAFTYGSLPNAARIVVSKGLFKYLEDEETETVYAHELGHIVHWDFAVMTLASTSVQITFLIYIYARRIQHSLNNEQLKTGLQTVSLVAYLCYVVGNYLLLYLSRTREYYADRFAASVTNNPNALSRSLVKIAYGIVEQDLQAENKSTLCEGTRALGIYDPKNATSCATAYRRSGETQPVGKVFLWDLFNPWAWWTELNSTHPLTGKRIRALSNYAEQMDINAEFDMAAIIAEGNRLDKNKLYSHFFLDLILFNSSLIGILIGLLAALLLRSVGGSWKEFVSLALMGFGFGTLIKTAFMYPDYKRARETDILTLMSDPYASPLRARPVRLNGELIGRADAGNTLGSDLTLQDETGMIFSRYASMWGGVGNLLFGMKQVKTLIGTKVAVLAWFRRSLSPSLDLIQLDNKEQIVNSYPRLGSIIIGVLAIIIGFFLPRFFH